MMKKVKGREYNTETAEYIGEDLTGFRGESLFKKGNGEYFFAYYDDLSEEEDWFYCIVPTTTFKAIQWSMKHLMDEDFKWAFGATKEDFISLANGTVEHKRLISKEGNEYVQTDKLTTRISLYALEDRSELLLDYWWVEDFDRAYIDWDSYEIVLVHRAEHYVPEAHALEMLKRYDTIDLTEED